MMHGPCGPAHSKWPYMIYRKCSKKYPHKFCNETISNEDDYPVYRRREVIDGEWRKVKCKRVWLDNRSIVPYCPYLSNVVMLIRDLLRQNNSDLDKHDLPAPTHEFASIVLNANRLILNERAYNIDNLQETVERDSTCHVPA
jgi:hypothetical protein